MVETRSRSGPAKSQASRKRKADAEAATSPTPFHAIGVPGKPWSAIERAEWQKTRPIARSYKEEVVRKLDSLGGPFDLIEYGSLTINPAKYPLWAAKSRSWQEGKPCALITGGVHGYETSGVQGALRFLSTSAGAYCDTFNILVAPCVSPWGYETIQRWNPQAVDPNRSFNPAGEVVEGRSFNPEAATEESGALIALLDGLGVAQWLVHLDLHETTDSDESEFRPVKAARDGEVHKPSSIPDGFYLVSNRDDPQSAWHSAIIERVRGVTHIAPPDAEGLIIGEHVTQEGVIAIPPPSSIGLCSGVTNAAYATTTEVYPDSAATTDEQCTMAQVAAIEAALDFIIRDRQLRPVERAS